MAAYSGFVVSGADTDAGKTLLSAVLLKGLGGCYWKPLQSGATEGTDTETVKHLTRLGPNHFLPEAYVLSEPFSPQQAAEVEGVTIDLSRLKLPHASQVEHHPLIIEGAGGLMVPIDRNTLYADLFQSWELPLILVGRNRLGVVNHMLLSIAEARRRDLRILGFVLSGSGNPENAKAIARHGDVVCIGEIPEVDLSTSSGFGLACSAIDIETVRGLLN